MNDSFTRSLYIGRDKAQEVARRREAVEKELKARRVMKISEHNEKIAKAVQQKENELKKKICLNHEKELQKQKAVLDRRFAQLKKDQAKKAKILQKVLNGSNSRSFHVQQQKKSLYVFGSSTPRELSYLETPKNINSALISSNTNFLATNVTTKKVRIPSRITSNLSNTSSVITKSALNGLSNNDVSSKSRLSSLFSRNTSDSGTSSNGSSSNGSIIKLKLKENIMTQSLFEPRTVTCRSEPLNFSKNINTKNVLQKSTPNRFILNKNLKDNDKKFSSSPLTIKSNKVIQVLKTNNSSIENVLLKTNINSQKNKNNDNLQILSDTFGESNLTNTEVGVAKINLNSLNELVSNNKTNKQINSHLKKNFNLTENFLSDIIMTNNEENNRISNSSSTTDLITTKEEWDSGHESNSALNNFSLNKDKNKECLPICNVANTNIINKINNKDILNKNQNVIGDDSRHNFLISFDTLDTAEKERENRRQKLNEILQRTRNVNTIANNSLLNSTNVEDTNDLISKLPFKKLSDIDASTLAQDLLAQRRQKLKDLSVSKSNIIDNNINSSSNLQNDLINSNFFDITTSSNIAKESEKLFKQNPLIINSSENDIVKIDYEINCFKDNNYKSELILENKDNVSENKIIYENKLLTKEPSILN